MEEYDWRTDPVYAEWQAKLYKERMSFDATVKRCGVDTWNWKDEAWRETARKQWESFAVRWNEQKGVEAYEEGEVTTLGFAAITLCYAVLPFEMLRGDEDQECKDVSVMIAQMANRAHFFEFGMHQGDLLDCFELDEDLTGGSPFPPVWLQWISELYNSASWWLSFLVFEREKRADKPSMLERLDKDLSLPAKWAQRK